MGLVVKKNNLPTIKDTKTLYNSLNAEMPSDIMNSFTKSNFNTHLLENFLMTFPNKRAIIKEWFQNFGIQEDDPFVKFKKAAIHGLWAGAILAINLGIFPIPISIMMNANIHHHPAMRFLVGTIAMILWPIVFIYALIYMRGRPYFGLFPLIEGTISSPDEWYPIWLIKNIGFNLLLAPFIKIEDSRQYLDFIKTYLSSEGPYVPEEVYENARTVARASAPASVEPASAPVVASSVPGQ